MWSKIGRLKRSVMPKLTKGSTIFGSGASPGIMSCIAGRLLCDTFLCSRDLLKEVCQLVHYTLDAVCELRWWQPLLIKHAILVLRLAIL